MAYSMAQCYLDCAEADSEMQKLVTAQEMVYEAVAYLNNKPDAVETIKTVIKGVCDYLEIPEAFFLKDEVNLESDSGQEVALEALRDIPGKIWRMIAKLLTTIANRIKALFTAFVERFNSDAKKIEDDLASFRQRENESEDTIKKYGLEPGKKIDQTVLEDIKKAGAFVFTDPSGYVLTKDMYSRDMTQLIPPSYRDMPQVLRGLVLNKKIPNIPGAVNETINQLSKLIGFFDVQPVLGLFSQSINIKVNTDFDVFNRLLDDFNREQKQIINDARLQRHGNYWTDRPVLGDCYPTFWQGSKIAGVNPLKCMFSYKMGELMPQPTDIGRLKLPIVTYKDVEDMVSVMSLLETNRLHLAHQIEKFNNDVERMLGSSGGNTTLATVSDNLNAMLDTRNEADIRSLQNFLMRANDVRQSVIQPFMETHNYYDHLIRCVKALLILIVGKGE